MRKLAAMSGVVKGTVFALMEPSITVGRADESMISLDDTQVSRHHALLIAEGDEYRVRDLNSANGTFVNGQRVTEARLAPGDLLQIGSVELEYERERGKGKAVGSVATRMALPQQKEKQPEPVLVLGSAVRTMPVPQPVATGMSLPPERQTRRAWTVFWIGVGLVDCIFVGWFTHHLLEQRREVHPPSRVATRMSVPPVVVPKTYSDPKGRFVCEVPAGWRVEEGTSDARSKVTFVDGSEEIRVIAQPAESAALTEADRAAVVQAFNATIERARSGGASGRLLDTSWGEVGGAKALQVELEIGAPRSFWMRQVKFRQGGVDHTVALYVGSAERREQMTSLFEKFLRSYRSAEQQARR